jgi:phosphonate transport system substrate-binding protein
VTRPTRDGRRTSSLRLLAGLLGLAVLLGACGDDDESGGRAEPLVIAGIPDQDPERLQRQFELVADHLSDAIGVDVVYEPVADYDAAVTAFRVGDLDLVWFGGLTGVQARLQVDGAQAIAQRDIDPEFRSVFIAGTGTGIEPFDSVDGLQAIAGHTFTFGSDSSTSGRLMPQSFLQDAGVELGDLEGEAGFSGSHDATIELVEAGTFEAGALNSQVWDARLAEGTIDTAKVTEVFRTPPYPDYHWVVRPDLAERYGDDIVERITEALTALDADDPADAAVLDLFGAGSFIPASNDDYAVIEEIGREIGRIGG